VASHGEIMVDNTMMCELCKKGVPTSDIQYIMRGPKGRMALCSSCRVRAQGATPPPAAQPKRVVKKVASDKQPFFCTNCRYKFKSDPSYGMPKCPYCGRNTKVTPVKETSAEELLKNSIE
jgi:hypothetical protein